MARPASTSITCPSCGRPFGAILEQIIDVGRDPTAKERLLSGRVNLITCPNCGYRGMVGTPLMYHDPSKQMAVVYVPIELNLDPNARQKLIGDLTNALMRSLPEDAPRGYLLQPKEALTMQGLVDLVLEADGITQEMIATERHKVELIEQISTVAEEELQPLLDQNKALFDLTFLELLTAAAQSASQRGDARRSLRLLNVRSTLMDTTEAGQELREQEQAVAEVAQELQALGEQVTRESFVDLLARSADSPIKIDALASMGRTLLDYTTFQLITNKVDAAATEEEKSRLAALRDRLLQINAEYERQARAMIQRSADTLKMLLQAGDIPGAIRNNLDRIDDMFLQILQVNLEEARKAGNLEVSARLKEIRDEVLKLIQASAPPEIRMINDLLSIENEEESIQLLQSRQSEVNEDLVTVMSELAEQLRQGGNDPAADRLEMLRAQAQKMLS